MAKRAAIVQPKFDPRISTLAMPLEDSKGGLKRGYMIWDKPIPGYSTKAVWHYLYNPSTIEASYTMPDAGVTASMLFPNAGDTADLRIPINQSASWSVLFDRTYELWGAYNTDSTPRSQNNLAGNNPAVVGVWADIIQLMEFSGMKTTFASGGDPTISGRQSGASNSDQGILQMVPCWAYFGNEQNVHYYGYISEWDVTYTHFTQYMVPMRAVVDISFTMLPPPAKQVTGNSGNELWIAEFPKTNGSLSNVPTPSTTTGGRAGR